MALIFQNPDGMHVQLWRIMPRNAQKIKSANYLHLQKE